MERQEARLFEREARVSEIPAPRLVSVKRATGMERQEARLFEREARVSEIPAECRERVAKQA